MASLSEMLTYIEARLQVLFGHRERFYETDFYNAAALTGFAPRYARNIAALLNAAPGTLPEADALRTALEAV